MDKETQRKYWEEVEYDIETCVCNDCSDDDKCPFAFDLYNTDEDCLGVK